MNLQMKPHATPVSQTQMQNNTAREGRFVIIQVF